MPRTKSIREILATGCRRSKECVLQVVEIIDEQPHKFPQFMECLWDADPFVASGAADALERLTRDQPSRVGHWKEPLLGLLLEAHEKRLRWNLALTVPRMKLTVSECRRAAAALESYLDDKSSVVKTSALHGLADLARQYPESLPSIVDLLRLAERTGTPAMRARSRILLQRLDKTRNNRDPRPSLHMFS
jgi:hypothetical protein